MKVSHLALINVEEGLLSTIQTLTIDLTKVSNFVSNEVVKNVDSDTDKKFIEHVNQNEKWE